MTPRKTIQEYLLDNPDKPFYDNLTAYGEKYNKTKADLDRTMRELRETGLFGKTEFDENTMRKWTGAKNGNT